MKKILALLLSLVLMIALAMPAFAINCTTTENESVFSIEAEKRILNSFPKEIALVEYASTTTIEQINASALAFIQQESAKHLYDIHFDFGGLMDAIAAESAQQKISAMPLPYTNNEVIRNMKTTVLVPHGPMKAQADSSWSAAVDQTTTVNITYNISISGIYKNYSVGGGVSVTKGHTITGPKSGSLLYNGTMRANQNYGVGVLYGSVVKTTWDIYDKTTNKKLYDMETITIPQDSAYITSYTSKAAETGGYFYIDSGDNNARHTGKWNSFDAFRRGTENNPERFLNGI